MDSTTTVNLRVNGQDAQQALDDLKKRTEQWKQRLEEAYRTGDTKAIKEAQKELNKAERETRRMQASAVDVERVMKNLDQATPKELRRTLKALTRELDTVGRGSDAWREHTEQIRRVRGELERVNAETRAAGKNTGIIARLKESWGGLTLAIAAVTGAYKALENALGAYTALEEAMADTRKFTGMTAEQVEAFNAQLEKMDTRTPVEQLHLLAQEAGLLQAAPAGDTRKGVVIFSMIL